MSHIEYRENSPRHLVSGCTRTGPNMAQGHPASSRAVEAESVSAWASEIQGECRRLIRRINMFGFDATLGTQPSCATKTCFKQRSERTLLMHLNHQAAFLHMVGNCFLVHGERVWKVFTFKLLNQRNIVEFEHVKLDSDFTTEWKTMNSRMERCSLVAIVVSLYVMLTPD